MTKERRLAIEMWEQIVEALENGEYGSRFVDFLTNIKSYFCRKHNLEWKYGCWFCQYVRKDWRNLPSRINIPVDVSGCQCCPLYKERKDILNYDDSGCAGFKKTLWRQVVNDGDVEAAKRILELLRGKGAKHD